VFEFATTPSTWLQWHSLCAGLVQNIDRPLLVGEQVEEQLKVAGRHGRVIWAVRECEVPVRWVAEGRVPGKGHGKLIFVLSKKNEGTLFKRELAYSSPNALVDRLFVRPHLTADSDESLRRLKKALERGRADLGR
jgi:hypothetical protein